MATGSTSRLLLSPIGGEPHTHDLPVPWRIIPTYTDLCAILAADGKTVVPVCRPEEAGRIVAAVNMVECAHKEDTP